MSEAEDNLEQRHNFSLRIINTLQQDSHPSCPTENEDPNSGAAKTTKHQPVTLAARASSLYQQDAQSVLKQPKMQRVNTYDINRVGF